MPYSTAIREAKQNRFRKFYEGIEQSAEVSGIYKVVAKDRAIFSVYLNKKDGPLTLNDKDRVPHENG